MAALGLQGREGCAVATVRVNLKPERALWVLFLSLLVLTISHSQQR